jgi:MFS transporter, YNFM family, putative membrane transport protein
VGEAGVALMASTNGQPETTIIKSTTWRIPLALFLAGFSTFSLLYCVQPLLPVFARYYHVSPAASSLPLSLSTGCLAFAVICAAAVSENMGRRGLMFAAMMLAAALNVAAAMAPSWGFLLIARAAEGFVLGGVPAVGMTYLAEEIPSSRLGFAMGIYVAGNAFGGMCGRVGSGILTEDFSWRVALSVIGAIGLATAFGFMLLLPPSRNFIRRRGFEPRYHLLAWIGHLRHPALPMLFVLGFIFMGAFVTIYNYAGFRLIAPPYRLTQTELGLIFTVYVLGITSSSAAGWLADRFGRLSTMLSGIGVFVFGTMLTAMFQLPLIVSGITLVTIGFFAAHSVASGWVGSLATGNKGHATSLYLLAYYLGSSVAGSAGGWFWTKGGWNAVVIFTLSLLALGLVATLRIHVSLKHRTA